ncbi:glycosyltransferase family 4 protein [Leptolyngbya boryana CZ1]|uniref:Glycosyltransferase family 4 protein n=1 Tax=Leptolyngbya boryana CZ1 TaxID=3060204 RepID=A0AA97ANG7_LEPBY|nr:glycosyltransferase family 4 protein [Leptolyngbya boryana]WNZ44004.1 glycosyltransferase family 4 protein [Leptolyngbya boryana CZ1]
MKICHVIYIPRFSGAEILVRELARDHAAKGHQIAVISLMPLEESFRSQQQLLEQANVDMAFPTRMLGKYGRFQFLTQQLRRWKPDIILGHAVIPSLYAQIAAKLAGLTQTSVINVLHDASQDDYASWYFQALEKWIAPDADAVVAVSQLGAENYVKRIRPVSVPYVIPNGINLERIVQASSQREQVRNQVFSVSDQDVVYLQVGRFNQIKQQHLTLQAYAQAAQTAEFTSKLFLAGIVEDPNYEQSLRQRVAELNLENQVVFLGARSDVPELLAGADVYLMPSKQEAHSVAFAEALASGITIVASDIPSFQYGRSFQGVDLIQPEQTEVFARRLTESAYTAVQVRWHRDLSAYAIEQTANAYLNVFQALSPCQ